MLKPCLSRQIVAHLALRVLVLVTSCRAVGFTGENRLVQGTNVNLGEALQFLREYDSEASNMCFRVSAAQWIYSTNMTDYNKRRMIEEQTIKAKFDKLSWRRAVTFDWTRLPDQMVRRQLKLLIMKSRASLSDEKYNEIYHLVSEMKDIYSHIRVCPHTNTAEEGLYCDLELEPDVTRIMGHSRNPLELTHIWREWHDKVGPPMKNKFMRYVQIANQAATMNGFRDAGEEMRYAYEDPDFEMDMVESWKALQPLYKELFTYVRSKLMRRYGPEVVRPEGPMPAHILGNLWAQDWSNIMDIVTPYPEYRQFDVTDEMLRQGFTPLRLLVCPLPNLDTISGSRENDFDKKVVNQILPEKKLLESPPVTPPEIPGIKEASHKLTPHNNDPGKKPWKKNTEWMFQMAEEFYTSLGLKPMPPEFWRYSMLDKPNDRKVQCTASAWDFCNRVDYRIKQCTEVNMDDLVSTHHEMAHIQYYLYYADQPYLYRDGANPGFHEAVSNAVSLSVFNPVHLYRVGLFNNNTDAYETNINFLMLMALRKVAFAPFAYLVDLWRYEIFQDGVQTMNSDWWELRLRLQGVVPPVPRLESHFDAAAKRHIPADIPYMRYYVALLLEFQIHSSMCFAAGHTGPLHACDVYRSREAGRILIDVLKVGKARNWKDLLRMLTRGHSDKISAEAMLQYFQPLLLWLRVQNKNESVIGWSPSLQDAALFQPFLFGCGAVHCSQLNLIVITVVMLKLTF